MNKKAFRPHLELLEDRAVPATFMLPEAYGGHVCDAEKNPDHHDNNMCWAAAASNVLEWTGWGKVDGMANCDDIFDHFINHWRDVGGRAKKAFAWWLNGDNDPDNPGNFSGIDVPNGANFFPDENWSVYFHELSIESSGDTTHRSLPYMMSTAASFLTEGYGTTLRIRNFATGSIHWVTLWGFDYNKLVSPVGVTSGFLQPSTQYTGIHITDSDDDESDWTPEDNLEHVSLKFTDGRWVLDGYRGNDNYYIIGVQALEQLPDYLRPDVVATTFNSNEKLRWGDSFQIDATISNQSTPDAADTGLFQVKFYLSSNSTISSSDYQLAELTFPSLATGDEIRLDNFPLQLPHFLPLGFTLTDTVWIGMIVDADDNVRESNEANNRNQGNLLDKDMVSILGQSNFPNRNNLGLMAKDAQLTSPLHPSAKPTRFDPHILDQVFIDEDQIEMWKL